MGRRPQLYQREDLHPGHKSPPGPEGASRPQRQSDGALLRGGSVRPQWSWQTRRKDCHLEGGVERFTIWKWTHYNVGAITPLKKLLWDFLSEKRRSEDLCLESRSISQPRLASASQRYEGITWRSREATGLHEVLLWSADFQFEILTVLTRYCLWTWRTNEDWKKEKWAQVLPDMFFIQRASLYWRFILFFVLSYHALFNAVSCFIFSLITLVLCGNLQLCFLRWVSSAQRKTKLLWLEISPSGGKENVYFDGSYALMDNVQWRVTLQTLTCDTAAYSICFRVTQQKQVQFCDNWNQIKTHKIRTNPTVFRSCCISLPNTYLIVKQSFYILLYLFSYKTGFTCVTR